MNQTIQPWRVLKGAVSMKREQKAARRRKAVAGIVWRIAMLGGWALTLGMLVEWAARS